jgi:hypothetical protein
MCNCSNIKIWVVTNLELNVISRSGQAMVRTAQGLNHIIAPLEKIRLLGK